jgi:hypothetical protein
MIRLVRKGTMPFNNKCMTDAQYAAAVDNSPHISDTHSLRCKSSSAFNRTPMNARSQKLRGFYDERNDKVFGCIILR